jgi:hypothetical protein
MPGTGSVRAGEEKPPPILPFTTHKESDQRPRVCRRNALNADERFCRRIRPADDVFGTHRYYLSTMTSLISSELAFNSGAYMA